jgi:hypothetical protein
MIGDGMVDEFAVDPASAVEFGGPELACDSVTGADPDCEPQPTRSAARMSRAGGVGVRLVVTDR